MSQMSLGPIIADNDQDISNDLSTNNLGDECNANRQCFDTNCCSKGKCQTSFVCYNGFKVLNDNCDYNYECYSRCCDQMNR
jgi:hypothetical protein